MDALDILRTFTDYNRGTNERAFRAYGTDNKRQSIMLFQMDITQ